MRFWTGFQQNYGSKRKMLQRSSPGLLSSELLPLECFPGCQNYQWPSQPAGISKEIAPWIRLLRKTALRGIRCIFLLKSAWFMGTLERIATCARAEQKGEKRTLEWLVAQTSRTVALFLFSCAGQLFRPGELGSGTNHPSPAVFCFAEKFYCPWKE